MRANILHLTAIAFLLLVAAPPSASAALTVEDVRIGAQPAFVRVVVDLDGATAKFNEIDASDSAVRDGSARVGRSASAAPRATSLKRTSCCACATPPAGASDAAS